LRTPGQTTILSPDSFLQTAALESALPIGRNLFPRRSSAQRKLVAAHFQVGVFCPQHWFVVTRNAVPAGFSFGNTRCEVRCISSSPEVALNQKVKQLIQKLGEAIHETVSGSEDIAIVVKDIRDQGFDVLLMLEATIGLNEVETTPEETEESAEESAPFSSSDVTFLRSLRISVNESDASADAGEASSTN
jgi:hypothetical protein